MLFRQVPTLSIEFKIQQKDPTDKVEGGAIKSEPFNSVQLGLSEKVHLEVELAGERDDMGHMLRKAVPGAGAARQPGIHLDDK